MRLITTILFLFLSTNALRGFCSELHFLTDTTKKHHVKHTYRLPEPRHGLPDDKIYYNDCVFTHKYSILQRIKKYPFSKVAKILAVSYDGGPEPNVDIIIDSAKMKKPVKMKPHGLIFNKGKLDTSSLFEIKQLTSAQVNRLTNMMFNTDFKVHNNYVIGTAACFDPRNAFIFFDKNGKVFDYIEICFECKRTESKSGRVFLGCGCNQELDMTKKFFIDLGIKYGTITNDDSKFN
jgi:hypothetical protein